MKENWKDIKGYEGIYQVSDKGRIKSLANNKTRKEKILKLRKDKNGYLEVNLHKDNKSITRKVHRLVAEAFISNPYNKPYINHKDCNPSNNNADNLEWCTQKENIDYSLSKPVCKIHDNKTIFYNSISEASRITGHSHMSIRKWCVNKNNTIWKYQTPSDVP